MAKYYKVLVTTTYVAERIVKAETKEDVENNLDGIIKSIDLLDDVPDMNVEIYERPDMFDEDVETDLTNAN